jgi:sugar lactone lactonase YvrE
MLLSPVPCSSGEGIAYITDSSSEGRGGLIVVDLGTSQSWRHLDLHPSVMADEMIITSYNGNLLNPVSPSNGVYYHWTYGVNAIAISPDGDYIYYGPLASRRWYKIATALLRVPSSGAGSTPTAATDARSGVQYLGRNPSHLDGIESDANGNVYLSAPEHNSIYIYKPSVGVVQQFVRDGRIQWPDTLSVGKDKKLYFTVNQLFLCVLDVLSAIFFCL